MSEPLLILDKLVVGHEKPLIKNINVEVKSGEIIAILGPSGIGKTTLLRTIAGLIQPKEGKITIINTSKRGGIGYIPQKLGLVRHASVSHNVDLGARAGTKLSFKWWSERKLKVKNAVKSMEILDKMNEPVRRLSGGEQRRVATARTLAQQPRLILADEFLSELDEDNVELVVSAVKKLVNNGSTVIMVEHHEEHAQNIADRIWKITETGLKEVVC